MDWIAPLVLHGAARADEAAIDAHAAEFRRRLAGYAGIALAQATPFDGEA
jgi:glutathione-regulated potassium-efflux system ancillary protein KefF